MRSQKIILESGLEVIIDHDTKRKCGCCGKDVVYSIVVLELVGLARWDVHKCKKENSKELLQKSDK